MSRNAILIDYEYCCGCHTCEVACQKEHGWEPETWGIKVHQLGPHRYEDLGDAVVYDYLPHPSDLCDLCGSRVAKGELPTCVKHCQTACMEYGTVEELAQRLERKPKQVMFVPR
ncbi:MAG: oxidoreductase [Eggerthellaceae bacterium]|nr:oxidoreductase [Eggerthellaceae bacterium]MDO4290636.1 oxidoreductase [Eggerthellaceae bacterium]